MSKVIRALVALTLVAGLATATARADATPQPEGASQSLFVVDVVVRGTPPPGAAIDVLILDATNKGDRQHHVVLDTTDDTPPDIVTEVGPVARHLHVDPDADAGATAIDYECQMVGTTGPPHEDSFCEVRTAPTPSAPGAPSYVYAWFWENVNQAAAVTLTLTFGACNGRPGTVFLAEGDVPTAGRDVILGTPAADTINGLGGDDVICGRGGNDTLRGGVGRDRLYGENGNDRVEGGARGDWLWGGAGTDTLLGLAGNDALDGGAQRDTCNGGTERDSGVRCEVSNGIP
jgi:hypothetical protein